MGSRVLGISLLAALLASLAMALLLLIVRLPAIEIAMSTQ